MGGGNGAPPGETTVRDNAYRSVLLCRLAGLGFTKTLNVIAELDFLYSNGWASIPYHTLWSWFTGRRKHRLSRLNSLDKSLYYHRAYRLALEIKKRHPQWGHKRVATEVSRRLPIHVPPLTVYFWITGRSRPNITPVKVVPELGYLAGVLVGDYKRTDGGLSVKDRGFIEYYVEAYEKVTGVRLEIHEKEDEDYGGKYYYTKENGGFMKALWRTGLWKTIALIYPIEFLQGLYDSEGSISPSTIELTTGDTKILAMARHLLHKLGFQTRIRREEPTTKTLGEREVHFNEAYHLYIRNARKMMPHFAQLIGFRETSRKNKLHTHLHKQPPTK